MSANNTAITILIRENTLLPTGLSVETEDFLPGWRAVKNLDGYGLGRKIEEAKWYFFYLVGDLRAVALGPKGARNAAQGCQTHPRETRRKEVQLPGDYESRFETALGHSVYECYGSFSPYPTRY
jgi:hypothetical protein